MEAVVEVSNTCIEQAKKALDDAMNAPNHAEMEDALNAARERIQAAEYARRREEWIRKHAP